MTGIDITRAWSLQYIVGVPSKLSSEWAEEEIRLAKVNFGFEKLGGVCVPARKG